MILLLPSFYFLFTSCLRQLDAHGLECVTPFSPRDLLFVPMDQLPRTFPLEQPAASRLPQEPKAMFAFARRRCKSSGIHLEKAKKYSNRKCRCDWRTTLQRMNAVFGQVYCLSIKHLIE